MSQLLSYSFNTNRMDVKPIVWLFKDSSQDSNLENNVTVPSLETLFNQFQHLFTNEVREKAVVFWLNDKKEVIGFEVVSIGNLNSSIVHPREVFRGAIVIDSKNIIFAHNHPSGNIEPSREDLSITRRMKKAGEIIGITLHDSVIFTNECCRSIITDEFYDKNGGKLNRRVGKSVDKNRKLDEEIEGLGEEIQARRDQIRSLKEISKQKQTKLINKIEISSAPLLSQYRKIKHDNPKTILLFKVGDCYQTFEEDAKNVSKALGTILTTRANGKSSKVFLTEFPENESDRYIPKLVRAGFRVAICEENKESKSVPSIEKENS